MIVMISGHFDGLHDAHLDYIKQGGELGGYLICVVSTDKQLLMKKGRVNIPQEQRLEMADLILKGLDIEHKTVLNTYDAETPSIERALEAIKPDILLRGGDKTPNDMPPGERRICDKLGIEIRYAQFRIDRHSSEVFK